MFGFKPRQFTDPDMPLPRIPLIEPLEARELLSATVHHAKPAVHPAKNHKAVHVTKTHTKKSKHNATTTSTGTTGNGGLVTTLPNIPVGFGGNVENTITFSQAPSAVQTGLTNLAGTDGQAVPTSSQTVYLANSNGVETYSLRYKTTGTATSITVDQNGNAVTQPTHTTTTFADLTASDPSAAAEITAIAAAKNDAAPTDSTTVNVTTTNSGTTTYSVNLSPTSGPPTAVPVATSTLASIGGFFGGQISVDAGGNPVGNQNLPFSVLPTSLQSAINANTPSAATPLSTSSTQNVNIETVDGVTLYTTTFESTGTVTRITIDEAGTLTSQPSMTTTTFSTLSSIVQNELQTLATSDGVTTAISGTQTVTVYTEANGAAIYAVSLSTASATPVSSSSSSSDAGGYGYWGDTITIAVDVAGNPTVPPVGGFGGGGPGPIGGPIPFVLA